MNAAVGQEHWDDVYRDLPLGADPGEIEFKDLFDRHLPRGGDCFEVGCYPGRYLEYLGRRFGYVVHGIDATPFVRDRLPRHLAARGVCVGTLRHGDFMAFSDAARYDVVCSFGFVEHFFDVEEVIGRHVDLVRPGGVLVLAAPNFRGLQYVLHRILDAENLSRHVTAAMSLARWARALEGRGMSLLHHGYYRTADFWIGPGRHGPLTLRAAALVGRLARGLDRRVRRPNRWLSPYLVSISRRRGA